MKRILITGAAGFIGSALCSRLTSSNKDREDGERDTGDRRQGVGCNARKYYEAHFSRTHLLDGFEGWFHECCDDSSKTRG